MITYPNQKILHINKPESNNFLQVDKDAWMNACNELTYNAFKVYLYLAGNQNGFDLALSKKALQEEIKMHDNTYTKVIKELTEKGYIVNKQGNIYDFYTIPHSSVVPSECEIPHSNVVVYPTTVGEYTTPQCGSIPHSSGGEIYKRDIIDIFYISDSDKSSSDGAEQSSSPAASQTERRVEDLSEAELNSLKNDYKKKIKYAVLYEKYNLCNGELDKNIIKKIDSLLEKLKLGEAVLLQDGTVSDFYYTNQLIIEEDLLVDMYEQFIDPNGEYKFDKGFVDRWFKEKYGYVKGIA